MSADASAAPLPQGPWTPVLLGPRTALPLSHRLRVARSLLTELSSGSSCCRNQEGRRRRSLPSSRISPPPPPRPLLRQAPGGRSALPPCSREDSGLNGLPSTKVAWEWGQSPHWAPFQTDHGGLGSCWPRASVGKGFTWTRMALTPVSTQGHFLINHPPLLLHLKIDCKIWRQQRYQVDGKGQMPLGDHSRQFQQHSQPRIHGSEGQAAAATGVGGGTHCGWRHLYA